MTARVSVIVPTYNRAGLIAATLNSILNQIYPVHEIIVIDDGSVDNTAAILEDFKRSVRYERIANSGQCIARNHGASLASGDWLAFCDSDDLWRPDHLVRHVGLIADFPNVEFCFSNFLPILNNVWTKITKFDEAPRGYWTSRDAFEDKERIVFFEPLISRLLVFQPIFPSTTFISRGLYSRLGGYNLEVNRLVSEDFEMHLRCVRQPPIGVIKTPTVGIRKHANNYSANIVHVLLGDRSILKYAKLKHELTGRQQELADRAILTKAKHALALSFEQHNFSIVHEMFHDLSTHERNTKERIKYAVSGLPSPINSWCVALLLRAAAWRRDWHGAS